VAGPADADKMDYLLRDSHYCGVKYGEYDLAKIVETVREVTPTLGSEVFMGFHMQGVFSLEEMLLARYHMHRQVYSHKTRIATDRMLVRAIELAIADGILESDAFSPPEDPDDEFVSSYLALSDSEVIRKILDNPTSKAAEVMRALLDRQLFKRILEYDFAKLEEEFGQPVAGYIARPSDKWVLRDHLHEAEETVAAAIGIDPHWVSLYWKEFASPISKPFSFNVAGQGILIVDEPSNRAREFNEVSQVFQQGELPAQMRITLYAKLPDGESVQTLGDERRSQIDQGMREALKVIGEASAES